MIAIELEPEELDTLRAVVGDALSEAGNGNFQLSLSEWTGVDEEIVRLERLARVAAVLLGARR